MELFRLLGTIAVKNDAAINALEETKSKGESTGRSLSSSFKSIGQKSIDLGKKFAAASAIATGALVGIAQTSANVAAEVSAYEQIMGDYADTASEKLASVADAVGMTDTRLTPYMTSMTAKFQGLGLGIEESTDLAASGLTIAADAAAFWDRSLEDSMSALNSFVNGNYEGGEAIGLFANETTLARYAAEDLGLEWQNLTEAEKQIARLSFAEEMQKQSKVTGQAKKEAGQYANVMAELKEAFRQLAASIGEVALPVITKIVEAVTSFVQKLSGMNSVVRVVIVALLALVAAASPVLIIFGSIIVGLGNLITAFTTLKTILPIVKAAFSALGKAMLANPIGIVIAAVTALVAAFVYLWNNCDEFRAFWVDLWEKIKQTASNAKDKIVNLFNTVVNFFRNNWQQLLTFVVNPFAGAFSLLYKYNDQFRAKITALKNSVVNIWNAMGNAMTSKIENAKNKIKSAIDTIKGFFPLSVGRILTNLKVPKIKIYGGKIPYGIGGLGKEPTIDIKWNAKGAIFTQPTIFNTAQGLQGVGEAGAEAVAPIDTLQGYVASAVASQNGELVAVLQSILSAIMSLDGNMGENVRQALEGTALELNHREFGRLVKEVI